MRPTHRVPWGYSSPTFNDVTTAEDTSTAPSRPGGVIASRGQTAPTWRGGSRLELRETVPNVVTPMAFSVVVRSVPDGEAASSARRCMSKLAYQGEHVSFSRFFGARNMRSAIWRLVHSLADQLKQPLFCLGLAPAPVLAGLCGPASRPFTWGRVRVDHRRARPGRPHALVTSAPRVIRAPSGLCCLSHVSHCGLLLEKIYWLPKTVASIA